MAFKKKVKAVKKDAVKKDALMLKRRSKKHEVMVSPLKVAEDKLRGLGEIPFNKEWKIVRSDAHNWTVERFMPERQSNRPGHEGKMVPAGWKRQKGFYHDFPSAAMAMVKLMGLDFTDDGYTVKSVKQILQGLQEIRKVIATALKKLC